MSRGNEIAPPDDRPAVLVVDDESKSADLYTEFLADSSPVRTAYSGDEALSKLDSEVAVVFLERRILVRNTHDERIQAAVALASKISTLEAKMSLEGLKERAGYAALKGEFGTARRDRYDEPYV